MKTIRIAFYATAVIALAAFAMACKSNSSSTPTDNGSSNTDPLAIYKKIYGATSITQDGDYVVITSKGLPDHKSPYYKGTQWQDSLYEAYNGTNTSFMLAPGIIAAQTLTFRMPMNPSVATTHSSTPLGPIGVSLNGVPFFNQYAGNGAPLGSNELNTFDQQNGHPTPMNQYHYHAEPWWLTKSKGSSALLGFLLDGFPVYGPIENGKTITNADLDSYHGHTGVTAEYPNGIYHYHVTAEAPYINGSGFYGTPGTVSH
ncbi:MAG: YHYH protein [Bacteroidetes bacterium]|nr:YHYH protein [Bacteroidota bacterium]